MRRLFFTTAAWTAVTVFFACLLTPLGDLVPPWGTVAVAAPSPQGTSFLEDGEVLPRTDHQAYSYKALINVHYGVPSSRGPLNLRRYQDLIDRGGWWWCEDCKIAAAHDYLGGKEAWALQPGDYVMVEGVNPGVYRVAQVLNVQAKETAIPPEVARYPMTLQTCVDPAGDRSLWLMERVVDLG